MDDIGLRRVVKRELDSTKLAKIDLSARSVVWRASRLTDLTNDLLDTGRKECAKNNLNWFVQLGGMRTGPSVCRRTEDGINFAAGLSNQRGAGQHVSEIGQFVCVLNIVNPYYLRLCS
ncbi:hypothetical protein J6590_022762 [Homalodisca vitripennis]|nr:hypothetical protein J6590_022762 [Homalodisca vitripennis]